MSKFDQTFRGDVARMYACLVGTELNSKASQPCIGIPGAGICLRCLPKSAEFELEPYGDRALMRGTQRFAPPLLMLGQLRR
jgi:hypothetical protein